MRLHFFELKQNHLFNTRL